jgi:hypothetical protein
MWFAYCVSGWTNTQVIKADSEAQAKGNAFPDSYGFRRISEETAKSIEKSWSEKSWSN